MRTCKPMMKINVLVTVEGSSVCLPGDSQPQATDKVKSIILN